MFCPLGATTHAMSTLNKPHVQSKAKLSCGAWSIVPSQNMVEGNILNAVTAISSTDAWTVGYDITNSGLQQTLIEHWDGTQWSIIPSPNVGMSDNQLRGVTAISSSDIWTVGTYLDNGSTNYTLSEHWDGTQWSIIPSPSPGYDANSFSGVTAISSTNVWAVGSDSPSKSIYSRTFIENWIGSQWNVFSSPNVGSSLNTLYSVTSVPGTSQVLGGRLLRRLQWLSNAHRVLLLKKS